MNTSPRGPSTAIARTLRGLAGVTLLMTIALLAVAPAHPFGFPELGCGAPAAWYVNGQPAGPSGLVYKDRAEPWTPPETSQPPTCRQRINHRLRLAAGASAATVGLLVSATRITRRRRPLLFPLA